MIYGERVPTPTSSSTFNDIRHNHTFSPSFRAREDAPGKPQRLGDEMNPINASPPKSPPLPQTLASDLDSTPSIPPKKTSVAILQLHHQARPHRRTHTPILNRLLHIASPSTNRSLFGPGFRLRRISPLSSFGEPGVSYAQHSLRATCFEPLPAAGVAAKIPCIAGGSVMGAGTIRGYIVGMRYSASRR